MEEGESKYTVDDGLNAVGFGKFQYFVLLYAGMGWVSEAMEMMLLSFIGPAIQVQWNVDSEQESLLTSVVFAGMLVGAYSWGIVSDKFGRRRGFCVSAIVTSIAGILSAVAPNYPVMAAFRCLVGLGLGGMPVLLSYFLEFVPAANRGTWMVVFQAFWTLGSLLEAGLAWVVMPRIGWRYLVGLSAVPSLLLLVVYPFTPESPRYLCLKRKKTEALKIMQKIAAMNGKPLPPGVPVPDDEIEVQTSVHPGELPREEGIPFKKKSSDMEVFESMRMLFSRKLIRSTVLVLFIFLGNSFTYYGLVLLTTQLNSKTGSCSHQKAPPSAPKSVDVNYKDVFITSFAEFPGLVVAALLVDRIGRKFTAAALFFGCCAFISPLVVRQKEILTTVFLFGARACTMGSFTTAYIYTPELYPTSVRSTGVGIASAMGRLGGMVAPMVAVHLVKDCHQMSAVLLFACVSIACGVFILLLPYETKGRDLSDTTIGDDRRESARQTRAQK